MVTGTEAKETVLLVVQLSTQAVDSHYYSGHRLSPLPPAYRLPQPHPQPGNGHPGAAPAGAAPLLHAQTYPLAHTSPDKAGRTRRLVGRCGRRWSMPFDAVEEETESSVGEV